MQNSIRTNISFIQTKPFEKFLLSVGIDAMVGSYQTVDSSWYMSTCICFIPSNKSAEIVTLLTLQHGSITEAFYHAKKDNNH